MYLGLSLLCLAGGLTGIGLLYAYYASCRLSQFWISLTLIVSLACLASSLLDRVSMGLLTPAFLFLYFDYQCWSAILSNPDASCNHTGALLGSLVRLGALSFHDGPNPNSTTTQNHLPTYTATVSTSPAKNWNTVVSLAFLALSLTYTGWSTYRSIVGQELSEDGAGAAAGVRYVGMFVFTYMCVGG